MVVVTVGHHPELTVEEVRFIFKRHFEPKYEVVPASLFGRGATGRDFVVRSSELTGVGVRLEQQPNASKFVFAGCTPSPGLDMRLSLRLPFSAPSMLFSRSLTTEVKNFIREAPEFQ